MNLMQNKTILKALSLYLLSTATFLSVFFFIAYDLQKKNIFHEESKRLYDARGALSYMLRQKNTQIFQDFSEEFNMRIAIFNRDGIPLFSNLQYLKTPITQQTTDDILIINDRIYLMDRLKSKHYKRSNGAASFVVLEGIDLSSELFWFELKFIFFIIISIILMGIIALLLVRIYTRPLKQQLQWFDHFLKDSTHEINTPLSVIMMSVERFDRQELSDKNNKKLNNIAIASKTLSHIYDDLVYLNFPESIPTEKTYFDLKELIEERLSFFALHISQKRLSLNVSLNPYWIHANRYKLSKLIDNLLSNAIKYNQLQGYIQLKLDPNILSIKNSGESIPKRDQSDIFKRYIRSNKDQGGFGIGLNIVKSICKEYEITIALESEQNYTTIILTFPKEHS